MIYHYDPIYAAHAEVYRSARMSQELKQEEAAALLGISKRYLQYIEAGRRVPKIDLVSRMSDVYDFDFSRFKMELGPHEKPEPELESV